MCTVTLLPNNSINKGFILTSNRDEAAERKTLPPEIYEVNRVKMLFPKDKVAGGTWIGVSEHQRVICLLNGAFEAHERKDNYRKSRGVVVKEILSAANISSTLEQYVLEGIEPFTIILIDWSKNLQFVELVWDGEDRYIKNLPLEPHIWSSSPLYDENMRNSRLSWFQEFLKGERSSEKILEFHHTGGEGNRDIDLIMDRGFIKTQSITQVQNHRNFARMTYEDLTSGNIEVKDIPTKDSI